MNDKKIQTTFAKMLEDIINKDKEKENDTTNSQIFSSGNTERSGTNQNIKRFNDLEQGANGISRRDDTATYQGSLSDSSGKEIATERNRLSESEERIVSTFTRVALENGRRGETLRELLKTQKESLLLDTYDGYKSEEQLNLPSKLLAFRQKLINYKIIDKDNNLIENNLEVRIKFFTQNTTPSKTKAKNSKDPKTNNDRGGR